MKKITITIILLLFPLSASLAQDYKARGEVFGSLGRGVAFDDEGNTGGGPNFGGGVGFRITPKVGIEGEVNRLHHQKDFVSGVHFEGTSVFATANTLYHFSTSRVQPYVLAGIGFVHEDNQSRFLDSTPTFSHKATHFAADVGAGVKIFVSKRLSIRPEFRIYGANEFVAGIVRGSVGIGYHW